MNEKLDNIVIKMVEWGWADMLFETLDSYVRMRINCILRKKPFWATRKILKKILSISMDKFYKVKHSSIQILKGIFIDFHFLKI